MCDILPEVNKFLVIISLRIGMLIISIMGVAMKNCYSFTAKPLDGVVKQITEQSSVNQVTGSLTLALIESQSRISLDQIKDDTKKFQSEMLLSRFTEFIPTGVGILGALYMIASLSLLISALIDEVNAAQIFVWVTFLIVVFGFCLILAISYECCTRQVCFLSELNWFTGGIGLTLTGCYLIVWVYFVIVANSYVVQSYESDDNVTMDD